MACPKCGSDVLIEGVRMIDMADYNIPLDLTVRVETNPGAMLFKNAVSDKVEVKVCGGCGFMEMYAQSPQRLLAAARSAAHKTRKKR